MINVRIAVPRGSTIDQHHLEILAAELRHELLALGAGGVDVVAAEQVPAGARVVDLVAGVGLVISLVGAASSVLQIQEFLQRWRRPDRERHRIVVDVTTSARGNPLPGRRKALIVANSFYEDPGLSTLRSPGADARELAAVLRDARVAGFEVEQVVDQPEATVRRRIAEFFADRDRDDLLLLHISCHGLKDMRGRLFLAARDTELRSLSATAVPTSFVADQMNETASRQVVLILDCCYSGAFATGAVMRGDSQVHISEPFSSGSGGRMVLTASTATEYSFEGERLTGATATPSVFTAALVEGLRTGEADLDSDGDITIDELYSYILRRVRETRSDQVPMKWAFGVSDALVIARSGRVPMLPRHVLDDLASDRIHLRIAAAEALQVLLTGNHAGLREAARDRLIRLSREDDSARVQEAARQALSQAAQPPLPPVQPRVVPPPPPRVVPPPPPRVVPPPPPRVMTPPPKQPPYVAYPTVIPTAGHPPAANPVASGPARPAGDRTMLYGVLGIVCGVLCFPVGIPLGVLSLREARRTNRRPTLAIISFVVGGLFGIFALATLVNVLSVSLG